MTTRRMMFFAALALMVLGGVGVASWVRRVGGGTLYTDGDTIREVRERAAVREVLWTPARPLSELLDTRGEDYEPRLSWDGTTLFFVRGKAGENADLYSAGRTPTGWSEPTPIAALNTGADELGPAPSADGVALYFYSNRPGGIGGYDLWVSRLVDGSWSAPENLGDRVNTPFNEYGPAPSPDGATLYFASNRPASSDDRETDPQAWRATVREDLFRRTYDLYECAIGDSGYGAARRIAELCTAANEGAACISPAGDFLYFGSDRDGGHGGFDLYRARRTHEGAFLATENLGPQVNSAANELDPGLAQLGFALYFSSDRARLEGGDGSARLDYDLYYCASREVYRERVAPPPMDWSRIAPAALWSLFALLLAGLLYFVGRDLLRRQLGLMTRCLLASAFVHALVMLAFSFWRVTQEVIELVGGGGPIQVTIAGVGVGGGAVGELSTQINAGITEIEPPAPPAVDAPSLEHAALDVESAPVIVEVEASPRSVEPLLAKESLPSTARVASTPRDPVFSTAPPNAAVASALPAVAEPTVQPEAANRVAAVQVDPPATLRSAAYAPSGEWVSALVAVERSRREAGDSSLVGDAMTESGGAARGGGASSVPMALVGDVGSNPSAGAVRVPADEGASGAAASESEPVARPHAMVELPRAAPGGLRHDLPAPGVSAGHTPVAASRPSRSASLAAGDAELAGDERVVRDSTVRTAGGVGTAGPIAGVVPAPGEARSPGVRLPTESGGEIPGNGGPAAGGGRPRSTSPRESPTGTIVGRVVDAERRPILGAVVRLDLSTADAVEVSTGPDGAYAMTPRGAPEFFVVTASHSDYLPRSANVASRAVVGRTLRLDFELEARSALVVALEDEPDVHHLGNDRFEGRINSQFQKRSEGLVYETTFELSEEQAQAALRPSFVLLARGVQCPHEVFLNGELLDARLDRAPADGSFGELRLRFPGSLLRAGENRLMIRDSNCTGDYDDFEFVNIRLQLRR